ncbi:MAG: pilus retraction protein PilT [Acidobacteria bacterium]|nr:pilus retraction protein PilT [Acidobacteriota bacterium]
MSIEAMLIQAGKAGARELRLVPGRNIVVATAAGAKEMQNSAQTAQSIQQLVSPLIPQAVRSQLAAGRAEWVMRHPELGAIKVVIVMGGGGPETTFTFDTPGAAASPAAASPAVPAPAEAFAPMASVETDDRPRSYPIGPGPTGEMDSLFRQMYDMKASDLHMAVGSPPMVRHDGEIRPLPGRAALTAEAIERILIPIAPERNREEFRRRNDTDFAYDIPGLSRFRCNFFRDRKGMGGVFRVIPSKIITAEEMGLSKEILELCFLAKGLVLVTGPTGSGKSTTLCALVDYINRYRTDHIITIEDPIEFVHDNKKCLINQRQVGEHTDSFKDALRAALREDPDIVLVGELRDLETVAIAIETAETGHLVFGTLHTSSAASTVDRIIDQFPTDRQEQIRVMLASSLKGVISQMLCRKIGGGRVPAMEVMIGTSSIANLIRESKVFQIPSIMQTSRKAGMCLMNDALLDLVKKKIVEPSEAYAKAVDKNGLISMYKSNQIETSWLVRVENPVTA